MMYQLVNVEGLEAYVQLIKYREVVEVRGRCVKQSER